ncbi:MAG TPA: prenyltransferase/squalene oxidase repeat-containing protein [Vicinamibacterales bacterium]|nr:prenyltransferase/squalene oxidase repeat-containing protein [Vicinamibacterales bacterium]
MLQVARLAPTQLGESRDLVAAFLRGRINNDGGFQDRAGASDLYYTVFGLDGLIALQEDVPPLSLEYLQRQSAATTDFVHAACLARGWAALRTDPGDTVSAAILDRIESCRSRDGGYANNPGHATGTAYSAFLAVGAYQDLGRPLIDPGAIERSLESLKAADGSYGNLPGMPTGLTTTTAAAVLVLKQLGASAGRDTAMWLLDRCHSGGGFFASPAAPLPDLLSTATGLHALSALHTPIGALHEPCLDFVDSLWTNRGGFFGSWADDALDCEYTYYGLLALGHLSIEHA